jgi:hypothetical protein
MGVIAFLPQTFETLNKVVTITASSYNYRHVKAIAEPNDSIFQTVSDKNHWVCYTFRGLLVRPTAIAIRSQGQSRAKSHLQHWVIEGPMNADDWVELDVQKGNSALNGRFLVAFFQM